MVLSPYLWLVFVMEVLGQHFQTVSSLTGIPRPGLSREATPVTPAISAQDVSVSLDEALSPLPHFCELKFPVPSAWVHILISFLKLLTLE